MALIPLQRVYRPVPGGPLIKRPAFRVGIEFEGMVRSEAFNDLRTHMLDLAYDSETGESLLRFGVDKSVKNVPEGYQPVEIRTTTMPYYAGMRLFEDMLCFLWLASQEGDWLTNETCGLHINVSERDIFERRKQIHWYCHLLERFDEANILRRFGREGSVYCRPVFKAQEARRFDHILERFKEGALAPRTEPPARLDGDKYLSVALRDSPTHNGYDGPVARHQRVEFRCFGNTDYHLRFDDLKASVDHIHDVLKVAYREMAPPIDPALVATA